MLIAIRSTVLVSLLCLSACATQAPQDQVRPPEGRDVATVYNCGYSPDAALDENASPVTISHVFIVSPRMRVWVVEGASQWAAPDRELNLKNACHRQGFLNLFGPSCSLSSTRLRYFQRNHFVATGETEIRVNLASGLMRYRERYSGLFGVRRDSDYEGLCRIEGHVRIRKMEEDAVRIIDRYPINPRSGGQAASQ
jgi:hypothetical protein